VARDTAGRGSTLEGGLIGLPWVKPVDIRTLGGPEGDVDLNLPALLRRLLVAEKEGKTLAQWLLEGLIVDALEGNPRATQDVLDRADQGRPAGDPANAALSPIDDETAIKILEILSGSGEDPASD
jgi:hypothetical protein